MSNDKEDLDINSEKYKELEETEFNDKPAAEKNPDKDKIVDMCIDCSFFCEQRGRFLTCPACGSKLIRRPLSLHKKIRENNKLKRGL